MRMTLLGWMHRQQERGPRTWNRGQHFPGPETRVRSDDALPKERGSEPDHYQPPHTAVRQDDRSFRRVLVGETKVRQDD